MASDLMVNWKDCDPARISLEKPAPKSFDHTPSGGKKGTNIMASIKYLYVKSNGTEVKDVFYIEQPKVTCKGFQLPDDKHSDTSVMCIYDISENDTRPFLDKMTQIYDRIVDLAIPHKVELKCNSLTKTLAPAIINQLIYRHRDPITDQADMTRNPTQYYKLRNYTNQKTIFHKIKQGEKFVWKDLENSEFSGFPLICFDRLFTTGNGKISVQAYLSSFVVLPGELRPLGTSNLQQRTINKIKETDPEAEIKQAQDLEKLNSLTGAITTSVTTKTEKVEQSPLTENPVNLETKRPGAGIGLSDVLRSQAPANIQVTPSLVPQTAPTPVPVTVQVPQPILPAPIMQLPPGFALPPNFPINVTPNKS